MAIYAIDFDNTLAITRFPEIIAPNKKMVAFAKTVKAQGHKIILWTSRAGADLENAVEWCRLQGIVFDAVNEPLPEQIKRWGNDTRKIYADYYIDDKNMTIAQAESTMNQIKEIETYKGIDRTTKQGTKPRVIFSESYNNLNRAKHTYSDETAKTKIVVGGTGDGADRIYVTVGGGTGFDLREEFLDAKDINKDDFSTNAEYLEALRIRGEQYRAENAVIENIEAEVEAEVNFIYGTDYDLGDIVTVEKAKWNKVLNLRITELCEVYEYGGMYVVPTFGDALPTTINWDN